MFKVKIKHEDNNFEIEVSSIDRYANKLPVQIESFDESGLKSTSKLRTKTKRMAWALFQDFRERARMYARAIIHNIGNTEVQIRQTIERYTRKIDNSLPFSERINAFADIIKASPDKFAKDLLFLEQRSTDLDAQLIGINLLIGKGYKPDLNKKHPLRAIIYRCIHPFLDVMITNSVQVDFDALEHLTINTDFRLFNCAMYHFFDNVQKYIKSGTRLIGRVDLEKNILIFEMNSRAIEDDERSRIFQEGFCGIHSREGRGEGLGMYIFSLVLNALHAKPDVEWDPKTRLGLTGSMYQRNFFSITFPKGTISSA